MTKERATIDFGGTDFQPRPVSQSPKADEVKAIAEQSGFTARHAPTPKPTTPAPTFDARSLRRTNRTAKLNIATTEEVRQRFWLIAQNLGTSSGEDALVAMMDALESKK